jgi:hypothetical protein
MFPPNLCFPAILITSADSDKKKYIYSIAHNKELEDPK